MGRPRGATPLAARAAVQVESQEIEQSQAARWLDHSPVRSPLQAAARRAAQALLPPGGVAARPSPRSSARMPRVMSRKLWCHASATLRRHYLQSSVATFDRHNRGYPRSQDRRRSNCTGRFTANELPPTIRWTTTDQHRRCVDQGALFGVVAGGSGPIGIDFDASQIFTTPLRSAVASFFPSVGRATEQIGVE